MSPALPNKININKGKGYILERKGGVKNPFLSLILVSVVIVNISGCLPLIVGGAVGALGGYAISRDTIQGEADKPYDNLWAAALKVGRIRGTIEEEDGVRGYIEVRIDTSRVWIRLIRLTHASVRLKVSARKHRFPNLDLAQDIFLKIMEEAR